ncbi:hypothetical protein [uncultured Desulfovibrio sp.]|uniref:hypothetical protein n=1 Tax=uncultured Desulfovibrio sp. TaxID=167968 RepID=UPI00261407CB|nr:hypothetical protein [uncultured Desulfovibrio sp.]
MNSLLKHYSQSMLLLNVTISKAICSDVFILPERHLHGTAQKGHRQVNDVRASGNNNQLVSKFRKPVALTTEAHSGSSPWTTLGLYT